MMPGRYTSDDKTTSHRLSLSWSLFRNTDIYSDSIKLRFDDGKALYTKEGTVAVNFTNIDEH